MKINHRIISNLVVLGQFNPPSLAVCRSLWSQSINVYLLELTTGMGKWYKYTKCLSGGGIIRYNEIHTLKGTDTINDFIESINAEAIMSCQDDLIYWLSAIRKKISAGCKVLTPSVQSLNLCKSKKNQIDLAKSVGFDVLPTWYLFSPQDSHTIPIDKYPICLRPLNEKSVTPNFKVKVIYSSKGLSGFMKSLLRLDNPVIAQPLLRLPSLVVHMCRSESGDILSTKIFSVKQKFEGIALSIEKIDPPLVPSNLKILCKEFASATGITGCFHFDFLYSEAERKAYFMEINGRLGGTTDKVMQIGYDEPAFHLSAYGLQGANKNGGFCNSYRRVVNKRTVVKHLVAVLRNRLSDIDYPQATKCLHVATCIRDLFFSKDAVFTWRDFRGSLWFYTQPPVMDQK